MKQYDFCLADIEIFHMQIAGMINYTDYRNMSDILCFYYIEEDE